jgi:hypothetical protein
VGTESMDARRDVDVKLVVHEVVLLELPLLIAVASFFEGIPEIVRVVNVECLLEIVVVDAFFELVLDVLQLVVVDAFLEVVLEVLQLVLLRGLLATNRNGKKALHTTSFLVPSVGN